MAKSFQKDLMRKPRVHIQYDVQVGDATKKISLPFVMCVLADLVNEQQDGEVGAPLDEREPEEIDGYTFDKVMKKFKPRVKTMVDDKLSGKDGQKLQVDLTFQSMDDLSPGRIAEMVPELQTLLAIRKNLSALVRDLGAKPNAERLLRQIVETFKTNPAALGLEPPKA